MLNKLLNQLDYHSSIINNFRLWKLASLISLSKNYYNSSLNIYLKLIINNSKLSDQEFEEWLNLNNLQNIIDLSWSYKNNSIRARNDNISFNIFKNSKSVDDNIFDSYKIVKSILLKSTINIPKLYFYELKYISDLSLSDLDKSQSNYGFLAQAIEQLANVTFKDPAVITSFDNFIKNNKSSIDKMLNLSNYSPKFIGNGIDGFAYDISNNLVLKIFSNSKLYAVTMESWNRLHKNTNLAATEAMIYDVGYLGTFEYKYHDTPIYYNIIEKMRPVSNLELDTQDLLRNIIQSIVNLISENRESLKTLKSKLEQNENNKDIKFELNSFISDFTNQIISSKQNQINELKYLNLDNNWLPSLVEEVVFKYLTGRADLHLGNLGLTKYKKFRYFDPFHKDFTSEINI